ncbi:Acetyltransferase [Vibrio fluvialis PG41]|uniref:Acetyltransferase n=2 Tax=Vibrio fluvialis TaxID=676 RepID=S7I4J8_VIBFL|nr:Acetyltransferase [Vibrio fluvialis PG41]
MALRLISENVMTVRFMLAEDIPAAALVHQSAFPRQRHSQQWLQCNFNAAPRYLCFVAQQVNEIVGYIIWVQKSGFRPEAVLELEQLAVAPEHQGKGIGRELIAASLPLVKAQLSKQGSTLKHILVTTRADNFAQQLYRETLGAEVETTISNLYSADEVLMIARNVSV